MSEQISADDSEPPEDDLYGGDLSGQDGNCDHAINLEDEFEENGLSLLSNFSNYSAWKLEVNLDPPAGCQVAGFDERIREQYHSLQYTLFETGRPETIDRTKYPRKDLNSERVVVAALSTPQLCQGLLLCGGNQLPDAFHLILSSSWFKKVPSRTNPGLYNLYVYKAITFGPGGSTYLDEFIKPRRVTYLLNYFTLIATYGLRNDGVDIEKNLECPMSSSQVLCERVDNKVHTRCLMAAAGVCVPDTIALLYKPKWQLLSTNPSIRIKVLMERTPAETFRNEFEEWLSGIPEARKIVVKPSGPRFCSSMGVTFHDKDDLESILSAVDSLNAGLVEGDATLVETFIDHIEPRYTSILEDCHPWVAQTGKGFRTRATVTRDHDNVPVSGPIFCGIGDTDKPINYNGIPETLATTLKTFNYDDRDEAAALESEIRAQSEAVLQAIIDEERDMSPADRGEIRAQTDLISIDYILTEKQGRLTAYAIEVNSHDCLYAQHENDFIYDMDGFHPPSTESISPSSGPYRDNQIKHEINANDDNHLGESLKARKVEQRKVEQKRLVGTSSSRVSTMTGSGNTSPAVLPLVRTMITRSQVFLMADKTVLLIGGHGHVDQAICSDSLKYGIKIILVAGDATHPAVSGVHRFVHYDVTDHSRDAHHATSIISLVRQSGTNVDACLTAVRECLPLAAIIRTNLGLKGDDVKTAISCIRKDTMHTILIKSSCGLPHFPEVRHYAVETQPITNNEHVETFSQNSTFPKVLKCEFGGSTLVNNGEELSDKYIALTSSARKHNNTDYVGEVYVMDYIAGSDHEVEIVIFGRRLLAAFISDNGPTYSHTFHETLSCMPSTLPRQKQTQLIVAAYQCCVALGITDGVFRVKLKLQSDGPKLLEIDGGVAVTPRRQWIRHLYGVDILLCQMMIACGIKPFVPKLQATEYVMGVVVPPSKLALIYDDKNLQRSLYGLKNKSEISLHEFSMPNEYCGDGVAGVRDGGSDGSDGSDGSAGGGGGVGQRLFASIAVHAATSEDAKLRLLALCDRLSISGCWLCVTDSPSQAAGSV